MAPTQASSEAVGPKVLITGGSGFVGRHLSALLAQRHPEWRLISAGGPDDVAKGVLDVADENAVSEAIKRVRPDIVVHLAALAAVAASTRLPREAWRVNLNGTLNLVLSIEEHVPACHLLFVSSAEVYGASLAEGEMTDESALLQPLNPYAASKAAADLLVRQAARGGLSATIMRPFNHTGVGQSEAFVVPSFASQIARIEAGLAEPIVRVGDLDDERDFLDVDDVIRAYDAVLSLRNTLPSGSVFNVASGRPTRIGDILDYLLSKARVPIAIRVDPERLRRTPTPRVVGDARLLASAVGWAPQATLQDTISKILEDRRRVITSG